MLPCGKHAPAPPTLPSPCAGSSTQVGVLVVPFCVVLAWSMGQPLDLNLNEFEAAVLFISVLLAVLVLQDGSGARPGWGGGRGGEAVAACRRRKRCAPRVRARRRPPAATAWGACDAR